jgi:hypothetical protein
MIGNTIQGKSFIGGKRIDTTQIIGTYLLYLGIHKWRTLS